jgi:hypothetical protein
MADLRSAVGKGREALGRIEKRQLQAIGSTSLSENEFRVYSQWGEDGIIQLLVRHVQSGPKTFIEFGVEDYTESNTRFLLINNNWAGLVIDASEKNVRYIRNDPIYWQHNLKAVHAFVTKDNINELLASNGMRGEVGILSIDIDGNDYWVWNAIEVITPAIVIVEYNFRFGKKRAVTIPYVEDFVRFRAHHSTIYYGASLKALCLLAKKKGYTFVGCNMAGNNAFFVRSELKPEAVKEVSAEEGFVAGQFRETRDSGGNLLYLNPEEEERILSSLPLIEL